MTWMRVGASAAAAAAIVWVGVAAQQQMQPVPGPGTGVMDVRVVNHPAVNAAQSGEWHVSIGNTPQVQIANSPTVTVAGALFLRQGSRYTITWSDGGTETVTVAEIGTGGWMRVQTSSRSRWINLTTARAIEEAR